MKMEIIIGMKIHRRNDTIDIAKGVGVALVIMGHTPSIVPEIIRNWISIFHMPLFFFWLFWVLVAVYRIFSCGMQTQL